MYRSFFSIATYLTMALLPGALTHIRPARLQIELWFHQGVTGLEQLRLDGCTVLDGSDVCLPVLFTRRWTFWYIPR